MAKVELDNGTILYYKPHSLDKNIKYQELYNLSLIHISMVNENGVTDQDGNKYYWTAPHDASEEVTDPYDLYSWDPGTNSYIPFQAAESDCSPVGRGNGWYYYDEDSGEYVPW